MNRTSRFAVLGAALAGLVAPLLVQSAQAAAPAYVALGDSYASGTGTRSYIADGTSCQRSTSAYPSLIAAARGYALTECAQPGWMSNCDGAINTAQSFINTTLPSRLSTLYSGIRSRSPYAKVV